MELHIFRSIKCNIARSSRLLLLTGLACLLPACHHFPDPKSGEKRTVAYGETSVSANFASGEKVRNKLVENGTKVSNSKRYGVAIAGRGAIAHSGEAGVAIVGKNGEAIASYAGIASAPAGGIARGGAQGISYVRYGLASSGDGGVSIAKYYKGTASVESHGIAFASIPGYINDEEKNYGKAKGGKDSVLVFSAKTKSPLGFKVGITRVAQVGTTVDGLFIKRNQYYRLNEKGEIVKAE